MKVLFTFYVASGGVETLNRLRGDCLQKSGIEAHFLYLMPGTGDQPASSPVFCTSSEEDIRQLIESQEYDAIVVTSDYELTERLRGFGFGGVLLYECQGLGTRTEAEAWITAASPYLRAHCDGVLIPPTDHLFELFASLCPWLKRYVISNILDAETFTYIPGAAPADPVIAWVGRLEPNKNWREFLEISALIRKSKPNLHLWMFQDPALATETERQAFHSALRRTGMQDRLIVNTQIPNKTMPFYYSRVADSGGFLLSTSITEGFGYAVAEAMLCSCPVLSTDSDGVRSFIVHNVTGKFYPLGNIEAGAREGLELMNNLPLRSALAAGGRSSLSSRFTPELYAQSFRLVMNAYAIF